MIEPDIRYAFGPYTVDAAKRRLMRGDEVVPLTGKAFDLMLALVENGGMLVSRESLYARLWPNAAVEDGNLTQNVYLVRRALDPAGHGSQYIETLPRYGYRFCAPVGRCAKRAPVRPRIAALAPALALLAVIAIVISGLSTATRTFTHAKDREALALGVYHLRMRTPEDLQFARGYFEQAVRLSPADSDGYAGLASTYALLAEYYPPNSLEEKRDVGLARTFDAAALTRNADSSDALAAAGFLAYRFDGNAVAAREDLRRSIAVDPGNAAAHHWLGVLSLMEGDTQAAVGEMETAHGLEPASEVFSRWLARAYAYAGRPRDALTMAAITLRIERGDEAAVLVRACAQEELGDLRGALETLHRLGERDVTELRFVEPDEARIEARLYRNDRKDLISRVASSVARSRADAFEASLFYLTVGMRRRADALLHEANASSTMTGLQTNDPRYKRLTTS